MLEDKFWFGLVFVRESSRLSHFLSETLLEMYILLKRCVVVVAGLICLFSCRNDDISRDDTVPGNFTFKNVTIDGVANKSSYSGVSVKPEIAISFSEPLDRNSAESSITLTYSGNAIPCDFSFSNGDSVVMLTPHDNLTNLKTYYLNIPQTLTSVEKLTLENSALIKLVTTYDPAPKFETITDEELINLIQKKTFNYFYDFAQPSSGMARERNTSGDLVTSGGSGFGLMALVVGIERNFISRQDGLIRLDKILDFLETADRFHGAYSHWINGNTGHVIAFSANDNGGDLVETSYLVQGLIAFRQYLNVNDANENSLIERINTIWHAVEWDWYTKGGSKVLYWHWSPDKQWIMNTPVRGYNEALITYVMAASSPTHTIDADVYHQGFARNGDIKNGDAFYGYTLPLGEDYGGPLFFAHYSFLGINPTNLKDTYANYWEQNVNHTLINYSYAVDNPKGFAGYSQDCWGLTASDNSKGYSAHSPTNDLGVITPTAALSSLPYTPEESMRAMRFFYYTLGDKLWGEYGFRDAFNLTEPWFADSYLAIDQGPIVVMIENYRSGLIWDLFMSAPEVQAGLTKLGFNY